MQKDNEYPEIIELYEVSDTSHSTTKEEISAKLGEISDLSSQESLSLHTKTATSQYEEHLVKIKDFNKPDETLLKDKLVFLGPKTKKYTLILDLDNTLVCTEFVKSVSKLSSTAEYSLDISIRPNAIDLLQQMSVFYEIVVFTAASEDYAELVVSELDPENKYIKKLISRKNCVEIKEGFIIKDLRIFADRELKDLLIVDDSVYSFAFHIENGIPVKPYNEDSQKVDKELLSLIKYLRELYDENPENIAEANKKKFWIDL